MFLILVLTIKLTLIFNHICPLVSNALGCFLVRFGGEDDQALILLHHVIDGRPNPTILGHPRQWEHILAEARRLEDISQAIRGRDVVLDEDGDNF